MPIERRDILFLLSELGELLSRSGGRYAEYIPGNIKKLPPVEAVHTRDMGRFFIDQQKRMEGLLRETPVENGVIFRTLSPGAGHNRAFFVPDKILLEIFLEECFSKKIMIPREAKRAVIVDGVYVGIRLSLGSTDFTMLELEDD